MSDSMRPHRWQPTRLPRPWDAPGKNTGVGCHFLLQCMKVKSESKVVQSCPTLSDPMDCSLPGSSVHGIFQARVLEWGAIAFSIKASTSALLTMPKPFTGWITTNWKILKEMGIPDHLTCLLRNLYCRSRSNTLEPDMKQWTGSSWKKSMSRLYVVTLFI